MKIPPPTLDADDLEKFWDFSIFSVFLGSVPLCCSTDFRSSKRLVPSGAKYEIHQAVRYQWSVQGSRWLFGVSKGAETLIASQSQAMNAVFSLYFRILFCVSDWIFVFPNHSLSFRVKTQISNALWYFAVRRGVARARVRSREAAGVL